MSLYKQSKKEREVIIIIHNDIIHWLAIINRGISVLAGKAPNVRSSDFLKKHGPHLKK